MPIKSRLLTLLNLLTHETDEDNPITVTEIIAGLNAEGFTADRKTIYKDIEILQSHGIDVICNRKVQNQYFIGSRDFDLPELALLVDAVQAARFIPTKRSQTLIKKLSALASVHQADKLNRRLYVDKQIKSVNDKVLYTVDLIHVAINDGVKITFQYWEYTVKKRRIPKHGGRIYLFSPYALLWNNDNYYVLGYSDSHGKVVKFRVDRITNPNLTREKIVPKPKGLRIEDYSKSVFQMFDGEMQTVTLKCENQLMKSVIDRFGEKVKTAIADYEHFIAEVDVSVSDTFFGWVVGFGGRMTITAPKDVKNCYFSTLRLILEKSHE
jgi:predicted DNA-binding transcriptional regulator YafY